MKNILKLFLLLIFIFFSNITFYSRVNEMIHSGKTINTILFLVIWTFSLFGFIVGSYFTKRKFRLIFSLFVCISTFFGMTYLGIGKHFLNFEDMELLWIAKEHASKVFSFYIDFMIQPLLISTIGFIGINLCSPFKTKNLFTKFASSISIAPFILLSLVSFQKGGYGTKSMPMQYSTISTFMLFHVYDLFSPGMNSKRIPVSLSLSSDFKKTKHILFIVDESIRSDYVNFKIDNTITPYISSNLDRFINFGETSSANNCSGYSNAVLRLGGIKNKLVDIGHNPSIWSYALKAGYKTFYVDGQLKNGELQNFMSGQELSNIDELVQFNDASEVEMDHEIALKLRDIVKSDSPSFVYINKRGSHFPYIESYDQSKAKFLPQMEENDELGEDKEKFINAYKNSISWNVDGFFETLLDGLDLSETIIFYTSDHGQNLLDRGIQTHCNTVDPHPFEGFVPAAIITDIPTLKEKYTKRSKVILNKLTHFHFFPEIIRNMGYSRDEVFEMYGVDFERGEVKQEFSAGALLPRFSREVKWYEIR